MAEEENIDEEVNENIVKNRIRKEVMNNLHEKSCNTRLEQLATPNRRNILCLWMDHAHHFDKQRSDRIKLWLQELYAMTPEETAKYFAKMREETNKIYYKKRIKMKLKKLVEKRKRAEKQRNAYKLFEKLLRRGLCYASTNPPPTLVSVRLRYLSDIILQQLCELVNHEVPDRGGCCMKSGLFLISVADWFAIAVENLYFRIYSKNNDELERIAEQQRAEEEELLAEEENFEPPATSTKRASQIQEVMDEMQGQSGEEVE